MANTWVEMGEGNMSTLNKAVYANPKIFLFKSLHCRRLFAGERWIIALLDYQKRIIQLLA